jgi:DNA polymerase-3 subunit epsilon
MKLKLERPLAIFDLEATGLNISQDKIVEIAIIKVHPDGTEETFSARVNPEIPIPAEVTLIHGISDADIKDAPTFAEIAEKVTAFIGDADLAGYNSNKFDIPLLAEELLRANSTFDMANRHFIDVQNIFHKMEQRTLAAAFQFYCQSELNNAHNALADTAATWDVLKSQMERYSDLQGEVPFLANFSKAGNFNLYDFAGRLAVNEKGEPMYNFGKHKGRTIREVTQIEPGYYGWMMDADFPRYTKLKLKEEMNKIKAEREKSKAEQKLEDEKSLANKLDALKSKFGK